MINMIIFDMDGVLVDSEEAIACSSIESLREWGIEAQAQDFVEFRGMGDDRYIGGVSQKYGVPYDVKMKKRAYEIYLKTAEERVHVFPWSRTLIETLHQAGMTMAVASASDEAKVMKNIACIGVPVEYFDAVITGSDVERKKPFPDIFLKAYDQVCQKNLDRAPMWDLSRTLVCEDAISGVQAAIAAQMHCVAVTTSFSADRLYKTGAHHVLDDLMQLIEVLKTL